MVDFCSSRLTTTPRTCPTPRTADTLDLRNLVGTYYEIGSTARYKLRNELGMACARTNFSIDNAGGAPSNDHSGDIDNGSDDNGGVGSGSGSDAQPNSSGPDAATINVVASGVPVLFGHQTLLAVSRIASAAANVCSNAAHMCAMLAPESRLSEAVLRISAVLDQMPPSSLGDASTLNQAMYTINASVGAIHARLDRLSRAIGVVAGINAGLSQNAGGSPGVDPLLRTLRAGVMGGIEEAREVGAFAINNLTYVGNLLDLVAGHVAQSDSEPAAAADLLQEASALIDQEMDQISNQVI